MNNKLKILFTATFNASFIHTDLGILKKHFTVTSEISHGITTFKKYFLLLKDQDITFSWFASVYSSILVLLTKLRKKKSIIVLGGVDVAKIPSLNYGIWNSWWKAQIVKYGIKNADLVVAVDQSIKIDAVQLAHYNGNNITVVPTGHDDTIWYPGGRKQNIVLTVANCKDLYRAKIKGIDFLFNVARSIPDITFILIGIRRDVAEQFGMPNNVTTYELQQPDELLKAYQKAKVYFQPSLREAFGSALCEAMLCECFPIGTDRGGIPTVIGDSGIIVPHGNIASAKKAIAKGIQIERCQKAREQIITHFSIERREKVLIQLIHSLING